MKIFNGLPTGQPAAKPHSLDGCLADIESDTFGNHRVIAVPILMWNPKTRCELAMELPILQSQLGICDWARQFKCQRRAWCERRNRQVACLLRPSRSGYYCHSEIQCARWKRLLQLQSPLGRNGPIRSVAFEINDL